MLRDEDRPGRVRRSASTTVAPVLLATIGLGTGCNLDNAGRNPPLAELHFPIALTLFETEDGRPLLAVANQNLDAAYNTGTLQTWDVSLLDEQIADCAPAGRPLDCPRPIDSREQGLLVDQVRIPTFARDLALGPEGRRFYVAIEGLDGDLTHVNVDPTDGSLSCGNVETGDQCAREFRRTADGLLDERDLDFESDLTTLSVGPPSAIDLGDGPGAYILAGHRTGEASLHLDGVEGVPGIPADDHPVLVDNLDDPAAPAIISSTLDPATGLFWLSSGVSQVAAVARVGVAFDAAGDEAPRLFDAGPLLIDGVTGGNDVRDLFVDDATGDVVILSREPEALLFATRTEQDPRVLEVRSVTTVCAGPSKLDRATIAGRPQLFVTCFDARRIDIVDEGTRTLITSIREAGGAFDLIVDPPRQRLYVTDFDNSTVRVASLAPLVDCLEGGDDGPECSPRILGSLGLPTRNDEL